MPSTQPSIGTSRKLVDYTKRGKSVPQHKQSIRRKSETVCYDEVSRKELFQQYLQKKDPMSDVPSVLSFSYNELNAGFDLFGMDEERGEKEDQLIESVEFYLKVPLQGISQRLAPVSDLRERFQRKPWQKCPRKQNHIQTMLGKPIPHDRKYRRQLSWKVMLVVVATNAIIANNATYSYQAPGRQQANGNIFTFDLSTINSEILTGIPYSPFARIRYTHLDY